MTYGTFLSTVAVVSLLAGVAILVVLSALTLAPLDKFGRRSVVPFFCSAVLDKPVGHLGGGGLHHLPN